MMRDWVSAKMGWNLTGCVWRRVCVRMVERMSGIRARPMRRKKSALLAGSVGLSQDAYLGATARRGATYVVSPESNSTVEW
jgi:hypothetical protein